MSSQLHGGSAQFVATASDDYFVRLTSRGFTGTYTVNLSVMTRSWAAEAEPNDSIGDVRFLHGTGLVAGTLSSAADRDVYFPFAPGTESTFVVVQRHEAATQGPKISIGPQVDETGHGLIGNGFATVEANAQTGFTAGDYLFQLIVTPLAARSNSANQSFDTAAPFILGADDSTRVGGHLTSLAEEQYFSFTLEGLQRFAGSFVGSALNRQVRLYDERGQLIEQLLNEPVGSCVSCVSRDLAQGAISAPHAGRYYLSVRAVSEMGLGPFVLELSSTQDLHYQRDAALTFLDFDGQASHLGGTWVTPFTTPGHIPFIAGVTAAPFSGLGMQFTTTTPSQAEYLSQAVGILTSAGSDPRRNRRRRVPKSAECARRGLQ